MPSVEGSAEEPQPDDQTENLVRLDERRRIARDLHDSTSQLLVALQLQLARLKRQDLADVGPLIMECERTIREIQRQIRSLDAS